MIRNYLKMSIRLMLRDPFLTMINVLGLSIGFVGFYILWPYTQSELLSDQFHPGHEQIARLGWDHRWSDNRKDWNEFRNAQSFCGVANRIADEYDEVISITRLVPQKQFNMLIHGFGNQVIITLYDGDMVKKAFREDYTAYADPNFFQFFAFPLMQGDALSALSEPGSVVISEYHSQKYFGSGNPINKVIYFNDSIPLRVTGVFKALPSNTQFRFDMLMSTAGIKAIDRYFIADAGNNWMGCNYIKVRKGTDLIHLQAKINERNLDLFDHWKDISMVYVQPLAEVVFTDYIDNPFPYKSKNGLHLLRALSLVILLLAWINYVSLSMARLHKRLPEVGTRRVVGASTSDFIAQFFVEAMIISVLSLLLSLTIIQLVRQPIEYLFQFYVLSWRELLSPKNLALLIIPISGVIFSGIYPVLVSSKKGTVSLFKRLRGIHVPWWIQFMTTFQYTAAVVLLIWIAVVHFQLNYILNRDTGVEDKAIIVMDCPIDQQKLVHHKLDYFMTEAARRRGVLGATVSKSVMGDASGIPSFMQRSHGTPEIAVFSSGVVDENFLDVFGIPMIAGRNFSVNSSSNERVLLISREAAKRLGFITPEECVGEKVILPRDRVTAEIIGVYEEYEFEPFFRDYQRKGTGSMLTYMNSIARFFTTAKVSFKIDMARASEIVREIEELYRATFPSDVFRWVFLDDNIKKHYLHERIIKNQIVMFTLVAIGIACLGLLATTSIKAVEKTKEIGIRKALGAHALQVGKIVLNATVRQVIVAIVAGIPIAFFLVRAYLERYSEQLIIRWWHYGLPIITLVVILSTTTLWIVIKTATTNPVEALRSE